MEDQRGQGVKNPAPRAFKEEVCMDQTQKPKLGEPKLGKPKQGEPKLGEPKQVKARGKSTKGTKTIKAAPGVNGTSRDELIETYLPLINAVAQALASRLPACVDAEDLAGVGVMGLIDAIEKYDPAKCDNFKNYARIRIKGAMLDELRTLDWVPRSVRQVATRLERKRRRLEQDLGRSVEGEEVATAMGVTLDRYHQLRDRALGTGMVSFEDIGVETGSEQRSFLECLEDPSAVSPDDFTHKEEVKRALLASIETLPEREQYIISLYYLEGLNLKEIGSVLGVTESRVSQIHTKALLLLRGRMRKHMGRKAA